ncbi:MAG TPA: hypothetical protein VNF73_05240 [Candidatus Saccharimonadales bacterium]|nr:hypothetical protein [Candidatus Saccharimonadales bacterium]
MPPVRRAPRRRSVVAEGTPIELQEWGPVDGLPVVHLHGLSPWAQLELNEIEGAARDEGVRGR